MIKRLFTLGLLLCTEFSARAENTATKVFQILRPSVVEISTLDGHGTGIAISKDGLILTNKHVADSLIIFSIKAPEGKLEAMKPIVYKNVRLLKVHPNLDLALVKVDAPDASFNPVNIKAIPKVTTGMGCYALGLPTGKPSLHELNVSVTQGIVSAASVSRNDGNYIQTTAPINPGNSGGPLCSAKGEVIGIVTSKLIGADNIGFAIPLTSIKLDEFKDVTFHEAPSGSLKQACASIEQKLATVYQITGPDRSAGLLEAIKDYASLIRIHGSSATLMNRLGQLHLDMKLDHKATICFAHVLQQEPNNFMATWYLGATAWDDDNQDLAFTTWKTLLDTNPKSWKSDIHSVALSLSGHGRDLLKQGRTPAASYCFLWARALWHHVTLNPIYPDDLEMILKPASLEDPSIAKLTNNPDLYSLEELTRLSKLTPSKDRLDHYATSISRNDTEKDELTTPSHRSVFAIELPEGASNFSIKNPKSGMSIDDKGIQIIWENAPSIHEAMKVMVVYELDGNATYQLVNIPAHPPQK